MSTRVAALAIIVESPESVEELNSILHDFRQYVLGRMGIPYRERNMNVITVVVDAPMDAISALSGRIGLLEGVSVKTAYSK